MCRQRRLDLKSGKIEFCFGDLHWGALDVDSSALPA